MSVQASAKTLGRASWLPGSKTSTGGGKQVGQALQEERQAEGKRKELWDVMEPDQAIQGSSKKGEPAGRT